MTQDDLSQPVSLLVTKINLPLLRPALVPRREILRQLTFGVQQNHLLSLISAPAGYGKTTTVRMWIEELGRPAAWVSLEPSDNHLKQFLTYILSAFQQQVESLGRTASQIVENAQELDLQLVMGALINDLFAIRSPIILVLEDYHVIENQEIDQAVEMLLAQAIPNLHLVVTTREDPNLSIARLRVRNQLTEVRAADLRFSFEEANDFFSDVMGIELPQNAIEVLESRTEGWVAGLQLAALSLKANPRPAEFVEAFRGTHRHVLDYLLEEVLSGLSGEVCSFLRQTSILEQLSAPLCNAVTGRRNSSQMLLELESNNLFLIPLDENRNWFRYHALFGDLLKNQLLQSEPERLDDLHKHAAAWYRENGYIQKAVDHAFQLPDPGLAFELIENNAIPMLYRGEVSAVVAWYDKLPDSLMQASPMMFIGKAWSLALMQRAARREEVDQALLNAEKALDHIGADPALRRLIAGHAASIQAMLLQAPTLLGEEPEKLIEISQKAQQLLPEDEKAIRSVNALNIAYGYLALADLPAAEEAFRQTFEEGLAGGNLYAAIYGPVGLILIAMIQGRLQEALLLCETNLQRFSQILGDQHFYPIGALYILKGNILLEQNHLAEAQQALNRGLEMVRWTGEYEAHMKGYSALARLRAIQGDWTAVWESLQTLEKTWPEGSLYAQSLQHRYALGRMAESKAAMEAARAWVFQSGIAFDRLPDIRSVDPIDETYFQTYLNVAHLLARFEQDHPQTDACLDAHRYLERLENFSQRHGLSGWSIEIAVARALLFLAGGETNEAYDQIQVALKAAEERGYFRIFVDEGNHMRVLLERVRPLLKATSLIELTDRILDVIEGESPTPGFQAANGPILSERELEVVRYLSAGLTYPSIAEKLIVSVNTVRYHIKGLYRKLGVSTRAEAIARAQELNLL